MAKRYFTLAEANQLVPRLELAFARILPLRGQLRVAGRELERLGEPTDRDSLFEEGGSTAAQAARGKARALLELLADELKALHDLGIQVKDLESGLCDFVARRQGRDVLLCWRLGEKEIGFWHELHAGYAGRRPIDETFARTLD